MQRITSLTETGIKVVPDRRDLEPVDDYLLLNEDQDLRGKRVSDESGELGHVAEMLVDPESRRVAMIELDDGRRVPIEHVRLEGSAIRLER